VFLEGKMAPNIDEELYNQFIEEFNQSYDEYMDNAQKIIHSSNPEVQLHALKKIVHNLVSACSLLNIDNLLNFFSALEKVILQVNLKNKKRISPIFDQALGIGFFKFKEIAKAIDERRDFSTVEVIVDVENLYQFAEAKEL
jgi:chemotaxis protein histidine kinase CheA